MQEPSRIMSHETGGGDQVVAGVVVATSHDDDIDHHHHHHHHVVHGTIRRRRADDLAEEEDDGDDDGEHGGGHGHHHHHHHKEPSLHLHDARVELPSDEDADDARFSFATAADGDGDRLADEQAAADLDLDLDLDLEEAEEEEDDDEEEDTSRYDYGAWLAPEPVSIQERRRRLLQGMGLSSSKDLLRSRNARARLPPDIPRHVPSGRRHHPPPSVAAANAPPVAVALPKIPEHHQRSNSSVVLLTRSRSDSRLAVVRGGGAAVRKPSFRRARSLQVSPVHRALRAATAAAARCPLPPSAAPPSKDGGGTGGLKNGRELMVAKNGQLSKGAHRRSAPPLNMDELERFIGQTLPLATTTQPVRRTQSQPVPEERRVVEKRRTRWLRNIKLVASAAAGLRTDRGKQQVGDEPCRRTERTAASVTMSKSASAKSSSSSASSTGPGRLKVHHYGKPSRELTGLYMRQEVRAHEGSIWSIKFSADGRFLASGGEDSVVRVWEVMDVVDASLSAVAKEVDLSAATTCPLQPPPTTPGSATAEGGGRPGLAAQLSRKVRRGRSSKDVLPDHVVVPETVFALAEQPACALEGHQDDVLDLSWSKSQLLLSSSMDNTVRLWDVVTKTCLRVFPHSDYVTCVQFNPADDGYFISGSLDCKVRIWSVPDRQVVDWSDLNDMVTAACYTPDGQAAIIGSHKGSCRFYKTTDCKLNQEAQIDMSITKKRRSQAKKITGFHFAPGNPSEILVTSADSQIRVFNGISVLQKFKGFKNTSSQISASYTADGRYVVCASEDSHVYVWRRVPGSVTGVTAGGGTGGTGGAGISVKAKTWLTSRSYEYFFCRDVSVAVPWPGSPSSFPSRCGNGNGNTPTRKQQQSSSSSSARRRDDVVVARAGGGGCLPLVTKSGPMAFHGGHLLPHPAELSRRESQSSARWHGGAEGGNAWGMVLVTASRGGEIRVYQNFGLPLGNLFH